jgi:tRNA(fMet)-specific endonuclease VapC
MLDTNICVFVIRRRPETVLRKLKKINMGDACLSSITLSELEYGVRKSLHPQKAEHLLRSFLVPFVILPFDENAALEYGNVRQSLERKGTPIGPLDTLIAAHAMSEHLILVTNNVAEFSRVENLTLQDWTSE